MSREERRNAITEIEAEISERMDQPAPQGWTRSAWRKRSEYFEQILGLYAEKEGLLQRGIQEMRKERAEKVSPVRGFLNR